ncbi:MAG: LD-carboxypeptidase [Armatimonadetes bacterium]|nr:LD-carboxypeptidase [Armatimonadota bacterium]MDE2207580.1 LD-carboxypeptidase [Armatimonadota bacterium]
MVNKPRALRQGDRIGIVAPSGPIEDAALQVGVAALEERGYAVEIGPHVLDRHPDYDYLAGTDPGRLADLQWALDRTDLAGIFCARGGYGAMRIVESIHWPEQRDRARLFLGYSDITTLHLAFARFARQVTHYGVMPPKLTDLSEPALDHWWRIVEDPAYRPVLPLDGEHAETVTGGVAEGRLAGGCLTLLAHACGTAYRPRWRGCIVVLEDVSEAIYGVDRSMAQLKACGLLSEAAGFVVGTVTAWRRAEQTDSSNQLEHVWRDYLADLGVPVITGFPCGHEPNALTLPLGAVARLDADAGTLTLTESAVGA